MAGGMCRDHRAGRERVLKSGTFVLLPGLTVADGASASTALTVSGGVGTVRSLRMDTRGFAYEGLGDLTLTLTSPAGTTVTLTSRNGASAGLVSADRAWSLPSFPAGGSGFPAPISLVDFEASSPLSFALEESFGAFVGEDPNGTWTLTATDAGALRDGGIIGSVQLNISGSRCVGELEMVLVTQPAQNQPIGSPVAFEVVARAKGPGIVRDIGVSLNLRGPFLTASIEPSVGGVCAETGITISIRCDWPGPAPRGLERRMRVAGVIAMVAPLSGAIFATGSTPAGPSAAGAFNGPFAVSAGTQFGPITSVASNRTASNGRQCTAIGTEAADVLPPNQILTRTTDPTAASGPIP